MATQFDKIVKLKTVNDEQKKEIEKLEAIKVDYEKMKKNSETFQDRLAIAQKYERYSNDPTDKEAHKLFKERMDELASESPETLKNLIKGYERMVNLQKNGLQQPGNPDKAVLSIPAIDQFEGANPDQLPPDQFRKAVDVAIDRDSTGSGKYIGGI